ncbi:MAG TPA: TolC family protein, partial [Polyangiaceae bacterium]|nr:TolC family protein [Polyangiaceae bacterium]
MACVNLTRVLSSTIIGSSLFALACASGGNSKGGGAAAEAPAPHLRNPAEHGEGRDHIDPVPIPTAEGSVSLGGILAYADKHSPLLKVARSTRSRAEAARVGASILLPVNPELTVAAGPRFVQSDTGIDLEVTLMQQLQIAGQRGARIDVADRLRDLTNAEIEQMRWAVHCDVHAAFHKALVDEERSRLAERVVTFQKEVLSVVERQIAAGETAPLSLRLAQAEVAQAEQVLVGARQAFLASRIRLAQLSGWPAATPPTPGGSVDAPRDPPSLAQLAAVAQKELPSLRAAVARVREAEARTTLAGRDGWPDPSLGVQYKRESNPGTDPTNIVMGVVSLPVPIFQTNQGERARAKAEVTVAEAEFGAAQQLLDGQIAEARSEVLAAAQRSRAYGGEILPRFEENLTLLRRSFELGEIDILALST